MKSIKIVLPTKNRASLLQDAVNSIKKQTSNNWELTLATDGINTDGTIEYINKLTQEDKRIKHVHKKKVNSVYELVSLVLSTFDLGDYIVFMTDDDLLFPNAIESHLKVLSSYTDVDASVGGWSYVHLSEDLIDLEKDVLLYHNKIQEVDYKRDLRLCHFYNPYVMVACCYKLSVLKKLGELDPTVAILKNRYANWDWLITALLLLNNYKVITIPKLIALYTVREDIKQDSTSKNWASEMLYLWQILDRANMFPEHETMLHKIVIPQLEKEILSLIHNAETYWSIDGKLTILLDNYYNIKAKLGYTSQNKRKENYKLRVR